MKVYSDNWLHLSPRKEEKAPPIVSSGTTVPGDTRHHDWLFPAKRKCRVCLPVQEPLLPFLTSDQQAGWWHADIVVQNFMATGCLASVRVLREPRIIGNAGGAAGNCYRTLLLCIPVVNNSL